MSSLAKTIVALFAFGLVLSLASGARAASCGDGSCDPGEDSQNCAQDCNCNALNGPSEVYGLCCCCSNGPNPQGSCTPKYYCATGIPIDFCQCCTYWDIDINTLQPYCIDCADYTNLDPVPGYCGGSYAYDATMEGTCGPAAATACEDTELTDDYVDGVNARTRCTVTSLPLGVVDGGGEGFSLDVSLVYNEARPPPAELVAGFPNKSTGPYGKGGWLSVDRIFTDEGIYWKNTTDAGQIAQTGVLKGTRGDRNGNGYVGYTLHTPYGSRTYDYPVMLALIGYPPPTAVYRSEPFDGYFLMVEEPTGDTTKKGRTYTLFQYPNGPWEIYNWPLSYPAATPFDPKDPVRSASLFREYRKRPGPPLAPGALKKSPEPLQRIIIARPEKTSSAVRGVLAQSLSGWNVFITYGPDEADGGMVLKSSQSPGKLAYSVAFTQKAGFHPEKYTNPGRKGDDVTTLTWDDWKLKVIDLEIQDVAKKTLYEDKSTFKRSDDNLRIASVTQLETLLGIPQGDQVVLYEACDISGQMFKGTTVSMPHNMRLMFEYGDDTVQHRLIAETQATGTRTQYAYNDDKTEPRGELTYAVSVAAPVDPTDVATLAKGFGTAVDWSMVEQIPLNAALFPADTFTGPPASKGVPVPKQLARRPDGLVLRVMKDYDDLVFLPKTVIDERGMTHALTYYPDTGQLMSDTRQGLKTAYSRSVVEQLVAAPSAPKGAWHALEYMETYLVGAGMFTKLVDTTAWDLSDDGRFYSQEKTGLRLDPKKLTSGGVLTTRIEKRMVRGDFNAPLRLETFIGYKLVAETNVGWDPRFTSPISADSKAASGDPISSVAPMGGSGVDGLGGTIGNWQVTGPGEKLAMFSDLDPLGKVQAGSANGVGTKLAYSKGPTASTLKTSVTRLSPKGEIPESEELETAGTTDPVCK